MRIDIKLSTPSIFRENDEKLKKYLATLPLKNFGYYTEKQMIGNTNIGGKINYVSMYFPLNGYGYTDKNIKKEEKEFKEFIVKLISENGFPCKLVN